jgi:23S rRNA (pseudouridine1915-N3)-methyltransferase
MKVELWAIGKTAFPYLDEGMAIYEKRLAHYLSFAKVILPDVKNAGSLPPDQVKHREAEAILAKLKKEDCLILLDERGKQLTSVELSQFMAQRQQQPSKRAVFLIGGAWGFAEALYQRANHQISMSKMTFPHQMVRLFFLEQLYRAMTILRGENYHNE